jgi:Zinc-finger of C2H2 type
VIEIFFIHLQNKIILAQNMKQNETFLGKKDENIDNDFLDQESSENIIVTLSEPNHNDNFEQNETLNATSNEPPMYYCDVCNYETRKIAHHIRHIETEKHKRNMKKLNHCSIYECDVCKKVFNSRSTRWRHKKKCVEKVNNSDLINLIDADPKYLIQYLLKENNEFKKLLITQNQQMMEMSKQTNTINNYSSVSNCNNKNFNLQFFLNETCKDAMNISDFVSSIKVSLEDLEHTGEKGYVEGISNIFIKNLNNLEQHMRPLHCSDAKREVLYIKDNDEWIKEKADKPILINAIKAIAHENIKLIKTWTEKYPGCMKPTSQKNDTYLRIVSNAMNGISEYEMVNNIQRIISNISKEVVINKHQSKTI